MTSGEKQGVLFFSVSFSIVGCVAGMLWMSGVLADDRQPRLAAPHVSPSQLTTPANFPRVRLTAVHDGDTITGDILFPFGVALLSESIRCDGYDAWEISRGRGGVVITDAELQKGKVARDAFTELLKSADAVLAVPGKGDRTFGRLIAKIYIVKGDKVIDVAEWMGDHGHTRE